MTKYLARPRMRIDSVTILLVLAVVGIGGSIGFAEASSPSLSSWFGSSTTDEDGTDGGKPLAEEMRRKSELVSPIVNRELEASVMAHEWPFTVQNVFCEAWAFHRDEGFLDSLVQVVIDDASDEVTYEAAKTMVLKATTKESSRSLLEYALALRAYSPACEVHRGLARQELQTQSELGSSQWEQNAFAVVNGHFVTKPSGLEQVLDGDIGTATGQENLLLPGEVIIGRPSPDEGNEKNQDSDGTVGPSVVLYANMGSKEFAWFYKTLKSLNVPFVVRHLGNAAYEEVGGDATVMQGYGVRLDIRNVEYRAFVDSEKDQDKADTLVNVTSVDSLLSMQLLAGINASELIGKDGAVDKDALAMQAELWKIHEAQQTHSQILPPKWQRRQLPLQAAAAISKANDVLVALEDVSQNLPSVASTLVHEAIPEEIKKVAEELQQFMYQSKGVELTVNGRKVPVGRPSFNVFEMLEILREEQIILDDMQEKLSPYLSLAGMESVQQAWGMSEESLLLGQDDETGQGQGGMSGTSTRINVGRGWRQAIIYVNDIERDNQYRRWPRNVQQALMGMQFGGPPSVRRNLFTILAVVDPLSPEAYHNVGGNIANQLMQAQYPARLGVLMVDGQDVDQCRDWLSKNRITDDSVACPTKPVLRSDKMTLKELEAVPATVHAAYKLFAHVSATNAGNGIPAPYYEYLLEKLAIKHQEKDNNQGLTMAELVQVHGEVLQDLGIGKASMETKKAIEVLAEEEDYDDETIFFYGKALRFALLKGIEPGMAFLNGRFLPDSPEEAGQAFMEEQNHVFGLIMSGEIQDNK